MDLEQSEGEMEQLLCALISSCQLDPGFRAARWADQESKYPHAIPKQVRGQMVPLCRKQNKIHTLNLLFSQLPQWSGINWAINTSLLKKIRMIISSRVVLYYCFLPDSTLQKENNSPSSYRLKNKGFGELLTICLQLSIVSCIEPATRNTEPSGGWNNPPKRW